MTTQERVIEIKRLNELERKGLLPTEPLRDWRHNDFRRKRNKALAIAD